MPEDSFIEDSFVEEADSFVEDSFVEDPPKEILIGELPTIEEEGFQAPSESSTAAIPPVLEIDHTPKDITVRQYIEQRGVEPREIGITSNSNLDRNLRPGEMDIYDGKLGRKREANSSYFWGGMKAINKGTESFFRTLDNAAETLSDWTGIPKGDAFSSVADVIKEEFVEGRPETPEGLVGDVIKGVGELSGLFMELAITPELKWGKAVFGATKAPVAMPKIITQLSFSNFLNTYGEMTKEGAESQDKWDESLKQAGHGAIEGAKLTALGYGAGYVGAIAKGAGAGKALETLSRVTAMSTGFGGLSALDQWAETGEVDLRQVQVNMGIGAILGVPELSKELYGKAINNYFTSSPRARKAARESGASPEELRTASTEILLEAEKETDVEKRDALMTKARALDALADIKVIDKQVELDPMGAEQAVANSELSPEIKEVFTDKLNEINAEGDPVVAAGNKIASQIKRLKGNIESIKSNKSLSAEVKEAQIELHESRIDEMKEEIKEQFKPKEDAEKADELRKESEITESRKVEEDKPIRGVREIDRPEVPQEEVKFTTSTGKQTVEFKEGKLEVLDPEGKEPSAPTKRKAIREYEDQFDFQQGERVAEVKEKEDINVADQEIIDKTTSPMDLVDVYDRQIEASKEAEAAIDGSKEDIMADVLDGKINRQSFVDFADEALIGKNIAKSYFGKEGLDVDEAAQSASELSGVEVTPQDLVDFMTEYQQGADQYRRAVRRNPIVESAKDKFRELTGMELNERTSHKAREQELRNADINLDDYYEKEYNTQQEYEQEFDRIRAEEADQAPDIKDTTEEAEAEPAELEEQAPEEAEPTKEVPKETAEPPVEEPIELTPVEKIEADLEALKKGEIDIEKAPDVRKSIRRSKLPFVEMATLEKRLNDIIEKSKAEPLEEAIGEASKNVDEFISKMEKRNPKAAGFTFGLPEFIRSTEKIKIPEDANLRADNPEVEKRWQASKGIKGDPVKIKVKEALETLKKNFTRARPELDPKNVTDARIADVLRQFDSSSEYSKAMANEVLKGITAELGPEQYDVFTRNIILPDLIKDIKKGMFEGEDGPRDLPFGHKDLAEVEAHLKKFQDIMEANPDTKKAYQTRQEFMNTLKADLVDKDLLPESVLEDDTYFHHQVLEHMQDPVNYAPGTGGGIGTRKSGWQKARTGSSKDYNTDYIESEFEVISQAISQIEAKNTIINLKEIADISNDLNALAKEEGVDAKDLIPEGYVEWNPDKTNLLYKGNSISDKVIERVLEEEGMLEESDVKEALMAGKRPQWIIPENIAKELDQLQKFPDEGPLGAASRNILTTWKQWTLLNPFRVIRYNLNNTSGDLDIAMAYNPKILKYVPSSAKELKDNLRGKAMTKEMRTALKKGVIGSGLTIAEIPDISKEGVLKYLKPESNKALGAIQKIWKTSKDWTNWRENILRLAAYKHFKAELGSGKKGIYGASRKSEIDAIEDIDDKAAKLARELIGDYGNVSKAGQWIRAKMMPFYSWMEVNTPRYVRLMKNLKHEGEGDVGRIAGVGIKKVVWKGTKLAVKATALMTAVNLWNKTFFPEEDKKLKLEKKKQQHLILGKDKSGDIISIRFQGALSDALSWLAAEDPIQDYKDLTEGDMTAGEKATEVVAAGPIKLLHSLRPEPKVLYETLTKQSLYPDPFNPKPIRDIKEHLARTVSLDKIYKWMSGKPTKGIGADLASLLTYTSDPGEVAYYGIKNKVYNWTDKNKEGESSSFVPSKKSNALYYYKQAIKYGDRTAAKKYYNEYLDLGGNKASIRKSIKRSEPLGGLSYADRKLFEKTLDTEDRVVLKAAEKWYTRTYKKGK